MEEKKFSDELVKGSFYFFIMFAIFNFLNFIFQFSMARILGPVDYGTLAALMTLLYLLAVPMDSVETLVAKYTSKFKIKKEFGKIKYLLLKMFSSGLKISILMFVLLLPTFYLFSVFFKINFLLVLLMGTMIFSIFLLPTTRGVMLGIKKFGTLGTNFVLEGILKLVIAMILVLTGMKVYGAVLGIIFGTVIAFVLSIIPLRHIFNYKKEKSDYSKIYSYSTPILFTFMVIMVFQSVDILLAKRFFSPEVAGQYAVANLLGKIIFFGTFSISKVMFPISSEKFESGNKTNLIFLKSLLIVIFLAIGVLFIYALFPEKIINLLFGKEYIVVSSIALLIGLAFSLISLSNLILMYAISINKSLRLWHLIFFTISQVLLLTILRGNLVSFSIGMIISGLIILATSITIIKKKSGS